MSDPPGRSARLTRPAGPIRPGAVARTRFGAAAGAILLAGMLPAEGTVLMQGVLTDSVFNAGRSARVQVLETGDTLEVMPGQIFSVPLPRDTLWNLCFRQGNLEKCYAVIHTGPDTVFTRTIAGGGVAVPGDEEPPAAAESPTPPASPDSARQAAARDSVERDIVRLRKVVVRAQRRPKRSLGKSTVSAKLIKQLPGLAEADVIRTIQGLPGVVASSDFSTKIYVRGGGADQNLILLDNAPVYSPVHFFGLFSTFLVEGIDEVDFYKGGFPSRYGNRLSSVLDIKSRRGGRDTADTWFKGSSAKASIFATQLHTEGRREGVRWVLAGRTTYIKQVLDFLESAGLTDFAVDYNFFDLQGNMRHDSDPLGALALSGYHGRDRLNFPPILIEWGNTVVPLNWEAPLGKHWRAHATASYSHFSQRFALVNVFEVYNRIANSSWLQILDYAGLASHRLSFGLHANRFETAFISDQRVVDLRQEDNDTFWQTSLFAQDHWTQGPFETTAGARATYMTLLPGEMGLEPRLSLKYRLPDRQSLEAHAGYYLQYINSIQWVDQETVNEFYYPSKKGSVAIHRPSASWLFSCGYAKEGSPGGYDFTLEGYYKALDRLLVFAPTDAPDSVRNNLASRELADFFKGSEGYSYGFEASLRKASGRLSGGLSYSHGFSVMRDEGDAGAYHPKWHQPHSLKGDLAVNWRGRDGIWGRSAGVYLRSSTQVKYATGLPYTEILGHAPAHLIDQGIGVPSGGGDVIHRGNINVIRGPRNGSRVPAYFRWDVKALDLGREGKWNLSWTLLNVTDHKNIFLYNYNARNPPERVEITQFPFFPLLVSYEYYF